MDSVSESQDSRTVANQAAVAAGPVENVMIAVNPSQQQLTDFASVVADESKPAPRAEVELEAPIPPPSEFDFSLPCQYFKSSFARSLSLNNSSGSGVNQSKSLDCINVNKNGLQSATPPPAPAPAPSSVAASNRKCSADSDSMMNSGSGNYEICPRTNPPGIAIATVPPIPARRQNIETSTVIPTASAVNGTHLLRNSCGSNISGTNRVTAGNGNGSINSSMTCRVPHAANAAVNGNFVRRNVCWPPAPPSTGSSSGEQECQLLDEAEHEMKINGEYAENRFDVVDPSTSVEAVILQNQVDTLQWQLKQAETSCGMYRAVMEEVARFLDRFQKTSAHCRTEQISRSKSMYHVYDQDKGSDSGNSSAYVRARSSTNLIDLKRMSPSPFGDESVKSSGEDHYSIASPISPYNTFKDFTYRRSPKKRGDQKLSPSDEIEEKLSKEAFRLSRTINNLLNTQQPDLTQHRQSLGPRIKTPISNASVMPDVAVHQKTSLSAEMLFLRTINMRDSRLSLRSSTDSSVHSTSSSSKVETDEENYSPPLLSKQCSNLCSTTEDESGFSSISSFQEIGVPLSSTMISSSTGSSHLDDTVDQSDFNLDSRNSTLKAATIHHTSNNVGLPLTSDANRWDMKTYRTKCQRFSTLSNEDSSTVLWV